MWLISIGEWRLLQNEAKVVQNDESPELADTGFASILIESPSRLGTRSPAVSFRDAAFDVSAAARQVSLSARRDGHSSHRRSHAYPLRFSAVSIVISQG
jgi:hypothetical protein